MEVFGEDEFLKKCAYKKTIEKAKGRIEKREYWQTDDSLPKGIEEAARAVRGNWMVESYHWHFDVTLNIWSRL